jgi:hypothetical protein
MARTALHGLIGALRIEVGWISVRPCVALAQRVREIHAQRDFDPLQRVEEESRNCLSNR